MQPVHGQPWLRFNWRIQALPNSMGTLHNQMAKQSYKPLTSKSFRSASKVGKSGRKRHGSHRSTVIGKYHFTSSPVMSLNQPGVIWTSV